MFSASKLLFYNLTFGLVFSLPALAQPDLTGNGMPNGAHFNLNVIGVQRDKSADLDNNNGHRIFVPLERKGKIILEPGDDFAVLDANGTDGNGATLQLPTDVTQTYEVYVRALGKPGGSANVTSCYTDELGDDWCLSDSITFERKRGKPQAINASKDLLYVEVCVEFDDLGNCIATDIIEIFSEEAYGYFWDYDNNGLKLAQFRFYPID